MKKMKYIYEMLDIYWNLKRVMKEFTAMSLIMIIFSIFMKTLFPLVTLLVVFLAVLIQFTHSWFKVIKPTIEEVNKEIELEYKYKFILKRFTK
jgi:hypothetical protein